MLTSKRVYVVLPKYSAYEFKSVDQKLFYVNKVREWMSFFTSAGYEICCFNEDMLAVEIVTSNPELEKNVHWEAAIGEADFRVISTKVNGIPDGYADLPRDTKNPVLIREGIKRNPVKTIPGIEDDETQLNLRVNGIRNRLRYYANNTLKTAQYIVYFAANNNYCNLPTLVVGDGKAVVNVDVVGGVEQYTFGGVQLDIESFKTIVRSVNV